MLKWTVLFWVYVYFYILMQTNCNVMFLSLYIYKTETSEIFNTMIEATLQGINKVHGCLTLYYCIKHCSILGIVILGVK